MRLLWKIFGARGTPWESLSLHLTIRGPMGQTHHQVIKLKAKSVDAAIRHTQRRVDHDNVLRWKLVDTRGKELAQGLGKALRRPEPAEEAVIQGPPSTVTARSQE